MTTFNTETVKAALDQVENGQDVAEEEVDEEVSSDDDDTSKQLHQSPKSKQTQPKVPTSAKTAPLPKTVGMTPFHTALSTHTLINYGRIVL